MAVKNVLVVGGGITGCVAAVSLAQRGVKVTLVEKAHQWYGVGHGITLQGNALKVFNLIGAYDKMAIKGQGFNELETFTAGGHQIARMPIAHAGGEDLPATMGALRSDIQTVLVDMIHDLGVDVRLGTELTGYTNNASDVTAHLSDGSNDNFDLIIAADGINSTARKMVGITHDKKSSGLGIWRVVTKRKPEMDCSGLAFGGPEYKAGYTPISEDLCYAFVLTKPQRPDNGLSDADEMRRLLEGYHGHFDFIRENLKDDDYMNFTEIEWLWAVDESWHDGRVIVTGDAVHACPPLIAQGGAQCSEDAYLLAEYVTRDGDLDDLLTQYEERRKARTDLVVRNTLALVDLEIKGGPESGQEAGKIMGMTMGAMAQPW
ncbi:MAG: FAD-dependent oxidoreductase [Actinomycetales bacterium]|nr:FAD-dependent oxidoreductase [Actinomycetales bacterium]